MFGVMSDPDFAVCALRAAYAVAQTELRTSESLATPCPTSLDCLAVLRRTSRMHWTRAAVLRLAALSGLTLADHAAEADVTRARRSR